MNIMPMRWLVTVALLTALACPAGAVSKGKQCKQACEGAIGACADRARIFGDLQKGCRRALFRRCKREGTPACAVPATCGNGVIEAGEACEGSNLGGATCQTLGLAGGTLACGACAFDQTRCWASRFVDNGNGTITDNLTGLQWEMKVAGAGCLSCADDLYPWATATGDWISMLNGVSPDGFKRPGLEGHSDWRIASSDELQTILVLPCTTPPCIDPVFGPTRNFYLSSTTFTYDSGKMWWVNFVTGQVGFDDKTVGGWFVRAVRGGS